MDLSIYLDRDVVVRADKSGVWMGRCKAISRSESGYYSVILDAAQKIHYWQRTAATSGLAIRGPGEGSRVCPPVDGALVAEACEVLIASASAMRRLRATAVWDYEA